MAKTKLHEVLAVEKELENEAKKVTEEAIITFQKKSDHFTSHHKKLELFDQSKSDETQAVEEHKEIVTTVEQKLNYVKKSIIRYFDAIGKKEATNQLAKANIILDNGDILIEDVPATLLLGLENRLVRIRDMYSAIPTLQPGINWVEDNDKGKNIFKSEHDQIRNKTERAINSKILVNPTKEHPAQIEKWTEDKVVGKFITTFWSGMITPADKSKFLGRIDELIRCIKKARTRANGEEVKKFPIGEKLFNYINSK